MQRILSVLIPGVILSCFYDPLVTVILSGLILSLIAGSMLWNLYRNRLRPLPQLAVKKKEESMIEREMSFVSQKIFEKAIDNGYRATESVPEKLKI